nr:hypothetical protein BaRGS_027517 [Batillaria attramentaria]
MICRLNRCSQNLAEYVEDEAIASREIEIEGFLKSYVYDSSVAVLCGLDLDHQDDSSHEFFRVVSDALKSFVTEYGGMCVPGRRQVDDLVNYFNGTIEERRIHYRDAWVQGLQGRLCDLVQYFKHSLIHRGPNRTWQPGRLDLIGILLQAGRPQMVNPISTPADALDDDCIVGALLTWVLHGNQTLLSTLQFVVHMLAQNQRQQELCCREIDDILGTDDPHEDALLEMTHLEKFIRETLRILPPVQEVWRSAKATCVVQGVTIPKGASVLIPVNLLHDDEQNFVHPFLFRPERFYGSDAVRGLKTAGLNLAFGGGSRMCLGMWITVLQVKIAIIYLLRRVTFMPVQPDPGALESDNFELQAGLPVTDEGLLRPVRPFKVIAIPRHPRAVYSHPRINQPMPIRNPSRSTDVTDLENEMLDKAEDGPLHQAFKTQKATSLWGVNYPSSRMSWGGSSRSSYPDSSSSESSASSRSFSPSFSFQAGKQTLFTSKKSGHAAESDPWKTASWNSLGSQGTSSGSSKRNEGVSSESKLGQPDRDIVADVEDAVTDLFGPSHFSVGRDETLVYGGEYVILTPSYKSFRPTGENDKKTQGMSGGTRARGTHVTWSGKPDDAPSDCRLILSSIIDTVAMSCDQSEAEFDLSTARAYMDSALNVDLDGLEDRLLRKKLKLESAAHRIVQAALDDAKDTDSEGYLAAARKNTSENRQIPRRDDSFGYVSITGPNQPSTSMKLVSTAKDDVTVTAADQPMISKTATNSEEKSSGKVDASVAEARQSLSSERRYEKNFHAVSMLTAPLGLGKKKKKKKKLELREKALEQRFRKTPKTGIAVVQAG